VLQNKLEISFSILTPEGYFKVGIKRYVQEDEQIERSFNHDEIDLLRSEKV
jgi:hypothetical protein